MNRPLHERFREAYKTFTTKFIKNRQFWYRRELWGGLLAALITVTLITWSPATQLPMLTPGVVAPKTLRAPYDLRFTDDNATLAQKEHAAAHVPPVYALDSQAPEVIVNRIHTLFEAGHTWLADHPEKNNQKKTDNSGLNSKQKITPFPSTEGLSPEAIQWLIEHRYDVALEHRLERIIYDLYRAHITIDPKNLVSNDENQLVTLNSTTGTERLWNRMDLDVMSIQQARQALKERLALVIDKPSVVDAFALWLGDQLTPNLWFLMDETERRREAAKKMIQPVQLFYQKGQVIIRTGEVVTEPVAYVLGIFRSRQSAVKNFRYTFSVALLVCLLISLLFFIMEKLPLNNVLLLDHPLFLVGLSLWIFQILLIKILDRFFIPALVFSGIPSFMEPSIVYAFPFTFGTMIWSFFGDRSRAAWFGFLLTLPFALMMNFGLWDFVYLIGFNFLTLLLSRSYRHRFTIFTVGMWLGFTNAAWFSMVHLVQPDPPSIMTSTWNICMAFLAGPLTSLIVTLFIPLVENAFGILTEIKLLELSNLNAPLLRELALKAPGTYFHSIGVGQLAEAAAEAIGANALFVKVSALYHDIGKMTRPHYFIENVKKNNPHDRLNPNVSRLIIFSHVKQGIRLARQYNLPQSIIDIIPQHHGTKPLTYFLGKARAHAARDFDESPKEEAYRYPGPKPKTREAAILMLSDGVEAAARSLRDPNPKKLYNVVDTILRFCLEDGQLDESNLTLADLRKIRAAMAKNVVIMFHQRVSYPGFDFGEGEEIFDEHNLGQTSNESLVDDTHSRKHHPITHTSANE